MTKNKVLAIISERNVKPLQEYLYREGGSDEIFFVKGVNDGRILVVDDNGAPVNIHLEVTPAA